MRRNKETLAENPHKTDFREAGRHSRGLLTSLRQTEIPQFITLRLFDSVARVVLARWKRELDVLNSRKEQITFRKRIEKHIDQGHGEAFLKIHLVAEIVQTELLYYDRKNYRLLSWVVKTILWGQGCARDPNIGRSAARGFEDKANKLKVS